MILLKIIVSTTFMLLLMINGIILIDYFENRKFRRLEKRRRERDRCRYVDNFYTK
ncbi:MULTISPECIES: hypothetical protein [Helcococcus]|uniref:Uncharacterized protein n=1 Tax=Helcococcus bovis TaxID=3153252 RepID=A0ABW9F7J3_9FIRM